MAVASVGPGAQIAQREFKHITDLHRRVAKKVNDALIQHGFLGKGGNSEGLLLELLRMMENFLDRDRPFSRRDKVYTNCCHLAENIPEVPTIDIKLYAAFLGYKITIDEPPNRSRVLTGRAEEIPVRTREEVVQILNAMTVLG